MKNTCIIDAGWISIGRVSSPCIISFASVVDNGDGTQTVQGQQDAQVEFKGQIGEIDP